MYCRFWLSSFYICKPPPQKPNVRNSDVILAIYWKTKGKYPIEFTSCIWKIKSLPGIFWANFFHIFWPIIIILFLKELLLFYFFSVLDVWDVYRGLFARIKRRVYLSESQPRVHSDSSIIHCTINPNLFSDKFAYKLTICNHRIKIMASDLIGKFLVYVFTHQYLSSFLNFVTSMTCMNVVL